MCYAPTPDKENYVQTLEAEVEEQLENTKISWKFIALKPSYELENSIIDFVNYNSDLDINFVCMVIL